MNDDALKRGREALLPYLPADKILACYAKAKGEELTSGKFMSPESSANLVANAFGLFLAHRELLELSIPPVRAGEAIRVELEQSLHFPWTGGTHPWLDVVIETREDIIAIESKRFEPFRAKTEASFSNAYRQDVWGNRMKPYEQMMDFLAHGRLHFRHLNAVQLVKHAFGLRTQADKLGKRAKLLYLYAEPPAFLDGTTIPDADRALHRSEIEAFAARLADPDCDVCFFHTTYADLIQTWINGRNSELQEHAIEIQKRFQIA